MERGVKGQRDRQGGTGRIFMIIVLMFLDCCRCEVRMTGVERWGFRAVGVVEEQ